MCALSVSLQCDGGSYACFGVDLYCPEAAECAMQCGSQNFACEAALILSDPDGSYNESLLGISCEGNDCLLIQWWCPEIANTTTECTRTTFLPQTPLNCNSLSIVIVNCLKCTAARTLSRSQIIVRLKSLDNLAVCANLKICSHYHCFRVTLAELARNRVTNSVLTLG